LKSFRKAIRNNDFAVSAEIYLRPDSSADTLRAQAALIRDAVDGILLTDNQYGQLHMSTLTAAGILMNDGVDTIVQMTSRNRNRIALLSDLLGAAAIGVSSLLLVAGERAPAGFKPRPKPVLDLNAIDLIRTAATINQDETLQTRPDFLIGGVATPVAPGPGWQPKKLLDKIEAGAQFVQTHICMDLVILESYMRHLVSRKLIQRTSVVGAVAVLESVEDVKWLKENRPSVMLPDALLQRLAQTKNPREEGIDICAETIQAMQKIPGIDGVSIMASRELVSIREVARRAGL
jgi:methylenetetrahydrofolate reductase (NADPH)